MSDDFKPTGNKEFDKLMEDILKDDPNFKLSSPAPTNIFDLKPPIDVSDIKVMTFTDLKNDIPKPIEYIFRPCLPTQGIAFIYAATGLGKTLFTMNLAYAIAGGGNFLKYECDKPRRVLYIDGEMPYNQFHSRLMMISKHQGDLHDEEYFRFLTPDKLPYKMPKIDTEQGQNYYRRIIEKYDIEVAVIDNLSMLTTFDENQSNEWIIIQDFILFLRSIGKTVLIVHHAGKDNKGYRGTSRMFDCADLAISLQPLLEEGDKEDNPTANKFKVTYHKHRIFGGVEANSYEVNLDKGIWSHRSIEQSNLDKVVERFNVGMNQKAIADDMCIKQPYVSKLLAKARKLGLITK